MRKTFPLRFPALLAGGLLTALLMSCEKPTSMRPSTSASEPAPTASRAPNRLPSSVSESSMTGESAPASKPGSIPEEAPHRRSAMPTDPALGGSQGSTAQPSRSQSQQADAQSQEAAPQSQQAATSTRAQSAPPPTDDELIEQSLAKLKKGNLAYSAPEKMKTASTARVTARIASDRISVQTLESGMPAREPQRRPRQRRSRPR